MTTCPDAITKSPITRSLSIIRYILVILGAWFLLMLALLYALYASSHKAVGHDLHAVALTSSHIHGSKFDCLFTDPTGRCEIMLDGQPLVIKTARYVPGPTETISSCTATFAGQAVTCEQKWVTSSYWPHGVTIADPAVQQAANTSWLRIFSWRTLLLGHSEPFMINFMIVASTLCAFVGAIFGPRAAKLAKNSLLPRNARLVLQTGLFLLLAAIGSFLSIAPLLMLDYVD